MCNGKREPTAPRATFTSAPANPLCNSPPPDVAAGVHSTAEGCASAQGLPRAYAKHTRSRPCKRHPVAK
eukprot:4847248-Alexandrium_andersonii.AAC.1